MIKIAVYGKGGIGKSTTVSNVSAALADMGYKVMQIGCDPKADSTSSLHGQGDMTTVLDFVRERKNAFELTDMVKEGYGGVICVEAGGPTPGLGCAGRGIIAALDKLKEKGGKAREAGFVHGDYEGNELQLPAMFIVNEDGVVEYANYARNIVDLPTVDEVLAML